MVQLPESLEGVLKGHGLLQADGQLTEAGCNVAAGVASFLLFVTIYRLHRTVMPIIWKGYNNLTVEERRDWDTRFGTMVFSAYIVHEAIAQLVLDDFFFKEGPTPKILRVSHASNRALAISSGFFLYELVVTLKYMMGGAPMVVHHCGSLACVALAYFSGDAHMFTIWMLSTECTTPFIAMRYLLDKSGLKTTTWYGLNGLAILFSWMFARLATFPPFFYTVWTVRHDIKLIQPSSIFLLLVFPVVLFALNSFWFTKILKGAVKHFLPGKKEKSA